MNSMLRRGYFTLSQLGVIAVVLLAWFSVTRGDAVSALLLPRPEAVLRKLPSLLVAHSTYTNLGITLLEILGAFALSLVAGLGLGYLASRSSLGTAVTEPLVVALYTIPIVLFYPLCILFFGLGPLSKIVYGGVQGFFPICLNTIRGLRHVEERYVVAAVSLGASRRQLLLNVLLPAAWPMVLAGIRVGFAFNLIGVIAGEMLGSISGLGHLIKKATNTFDTADLYGYVFLLFTLTAVFNVLIARRGDRTDFNP